MLKHNVRLWLLRTVAVSLVGVVSSSALIQSGLAQNAIIPDATLGGEASIVSPIVPFLADFERIDGGAVRGQNLFHSFTEFSINETGSALFITPSADIANIFARITGGNPSEILGVLGTRQADLSRSNADLFLINPNGIIFGKNSALDVGGSFVASTADAVEFDQLGRFSATNPEVPSLLLTIAPSALFFNQLETAAITNQSRSQRSGLDPSGSFAPFGLRVPDGESLLLAGGNVDIDKGGLVAFGGHIGVGGLAANGSISLEQDNNRLSFQFSESVNLADVSLTDAAGLIVAKDGLGSIDITSNNLRLSGGSFIEAGVLSGITPVESAYGSINLSATGTLTIEDNSRVFNVLFFGSRGNTGDITLSAQNLNLNNGSQLSASVDGNGNVGKVILRVRDTITLDDGDNGTFIFNSIFSNRQGTTGGIEVYTGSLRILNGAQIQAGVDNNGQGNAGDIIISAEQDVVVDGTEDPNDLNASPSVIYTGVGRGARGDGGNLQITGQNVYITNRGQLISQTSGTGDAGDIIVRAEDNIYLLNSIVISEVTEETGNGNGGDIILEAKVLELINGSSLLADTENIGDAGNITIRASERVTLSGEGLGAGNPEEILPSQISTTVDGQTARGEGGDINIATGLLSLTDRAFINAGTSGEGGGGDIDIATGSLSLTDRAFINAGTSGEGRGDGGDIYIATGLLSLTDGAIISSRNSSGATGDAGNLQITGRSIYITNGSQLASTTEGNGNAGDIIVRAQNNIYLLNSIIISEVTEETGIGNSGDIILEAKVLELINGSSLLAGTENIGDAGNITIRASERVTLSGEGPGAGNPEEILPSQISTTVDAQAEIGDVGEIDITTGLLALTDRAFIIASSFGEGSAGDVRIQTNSLRIEGGAVIGAFPGNTKDNTGSVFITASDEVFISGRDSMGEPSRISSSSLGNVTGNGGVLFIVSPRISLLDGARISATSEGPGLAGSINFFLDRLEATDGTVETSAIQSQGGDINVNATSSSPKGIIILRGDSDFTTDSLGDGGNINLNAIVIAFDDSDILARSSDALGGNITLGPFFSNTLPIGAVSPIENNDRVDVSADGRLASGSITTPDTSFIQNSLNQLPAIVTDPNTLIAGSCIARTAEGQGTFVATGSGGLPTSPGDGVISSYPTGHVQSLPSPEPQAVWQPGDPIVEPTDVFSLPDGRLVLSQACGDN